MASSNKRKRTLFEFYSKCPISHNAKKCTEKEIGSVRSSVKLKKHGSQLTLNGKILPSTNRNGSDVAMFSLTMSPTLSTRNVVQKERTVLKQISPKQDGKEQMYLDAGQKAFGHTVCKVCGMVYMKAQEEDEAYHAKHHDKIAHILRFNGWKNERVVKEYYDGKIICIHETDPPSHRKKLNEILEVVDLELSCSTRYQDNANGFKGYLFISSKKVVGLVLAMSIKQGYPIIESETPDKSDGGKSQLSFCCSNEVKEAMCGVNRIWVFSRNRRQGIASRLVDTLRHDFIYGYVIEKKFLAFSDPTPNGRAFAEKYVGKSNVLVFR